MQITAKEYQEFKKICEKGGKKLVLSRSKFTLPTQAKSSSE